MWRLFFWLSGADSDILAKCTQMQRSERVRFAGVGALVLIPAIVGLFSMTYAVSTVVHEPTIYVTAGILWSAIVLTIDRYLVSTLHKSSLGNRSGRALAIIARYVFAIFVGIAVAHPLVLLWFDKSIHQRIDQDRRQAVSTRFKAAEDQKAALPAVTTSQTLGDVSKLDDALSKKVDALSATLDARVANRDCLRQLQTAEQSGTQVGLPCGFSSGLKECATRCAVIGAQIAQADQEIGDLSMQLAAARKTRDAQVGDAESGGQAQISAQEADRAAKIKEIDQRANVDVQAITAKFSDDYLARVDALAELGRDQPEVKYVSWFMVLFFVFIDILPVTMKIATPMGEYEEIRDTLLFDRQMKQRAEREVAEHDVAYKASAQAKASMSAQLDEINVLGNVTSDLVADYTAGSIEFEKRLKTMRHEVGKDPEEQAVFTAHARALRGLANESWNKGFARFKTFLERS